MTTMVTEVYDARADLAEIRTDIAGMKGQLGSMRALVGVNLTVTLATLGTTAGLFVKLFH